MSTDHRGTAEAEKAAGSGKKSGFFSRIMKKKEKGERPETAESGQPDSAHRHTLDRTVSAPVSGRVIPLSQVPDEAFSSGVLGQGVGIMPDGDMVCAPFDGTVDMLSGTGHAIGLRRGDGMALLIHVGIDTVRLNGQGFQAAVKEGAKVQKGDTLIRFDRTFLTQEGYDPTVVILITEPPEGSPEGSPKGRPEGLPSGQEITCAAECGGTVGIGDPLLSLRYEEAQA